MNEKSCATRHHRSGSKDDHGYSAVPAINTRQLKDHVPLRSEFDHVQLAGQPALGEREAWNADALMEGVSVGSGELNFRQRLRTDVFFVSFFVLFFL